MSCCEGACCVNICVSMPVESIRTSTTVEDGDLLGFMLRKITFEEAQARAERFGIRVPTNDDGQYHKCIYWDEDSRRCGAYADRPTMCSEYPYPWGSQYRRSRGRDSGVCEHDCGCEGSPLLWDGED
jgi:Fe-S-cluster containining protein